MKLDIGCGNKKWIGFVGVDRVLCEGVDVVCDLSKTPWPFIPVCVKVSTKRS